MGESKEEDVRVTLYLLREGTRASATVLRNSANYREVAIQHDGDASWKLFVKAGWSREAAWVSDLRAIVRDDTLGELRTQSSAAVLFVTQDSRLFAVTFGSGFHAIDPNSLERGFGLRVTANVIAGVTGADTRGLNRTGRSQKTMLPAANEFYALGVEPTEEWVRQLSGRVDEQDFAATAAGADSLRLTIKDFSLQQLPDKLRQIMSRFVSEDYKRDFGFLDNFIRLEARDPLVDELTATLENLVRRQDGDVYFAAPDPFEQLDVDHYTVKYRRTIRVEQLNQDEVYAALGKLDLPDGPLRKVKVEAYNGDGHPIDKKYNLYDYLQVELPRGDVRFVLTSGTWFRVSDDYVQEIKSSVAGLGDLTDELKLPTWDKKALDADASDKTAEGSYNKQVADDHNHLLLDKKNFYIGGRYQKIEICDLLTAERHLICVKRSTRSSTLSHLFAQGSVSASLMHEPSYKTAVLEHLAKLGVDEDFGSPSQWTFVYAIATEKPGCLADSLFFFSQANLVTHARDIMSRGFRVALARIDVR